MQKDINCGNQAKNILSLSFLLFEETIRKVRRRYWVLRHLKRHGLDEQELVRVYTSILRATVEFCSVVYGSVLTGEQSEDLERLQAQSLKIIFGFNRSASEVRELAGVETLEERRRAALGRFAKKALEGKHQHWFPVNSGRKSRHTKHFKEDFAR